MLLKFQVAEIWINALRGRSLFITYKYVEGWEELQEGGRFWTENPALGRALTLVKRNL